MTAQGRNGRGRGVSLVRRLRPRSCAECFTGLVAVALVGGGVFMAQLPVAANPAPSAIVLDEDGSGQPSGGPLSTEQARALWAGWEELTAEDPAPPRQVGVLPRPTRSASTMAVPAPAVPVLPTPDTTRPADPRRTTEPAPGPNTGTPQPGQRQADTAPVDILTPERPSPPQDTTPLAPVPSPTPSRPAPSTPAPAPSTPAPTTPAPDAPTSLEQPKPTEPSRTSPAPEETTRSTPPPSSTGSSSSESSTTQAEPDGPAATPTP